MSPEILLALAGFAFASSITPGPNNMMLLASGATYGVRRTLPHMLGIALGHAAMILTLGAGVAELFHQMPAAQLVLKILSALYMLWLAWKIATAVAPEAGEVTGRPMTFLQAAAFQWVNPKAWAMALTALTVYLPQPGLAGVALVAAMFCLVNFPSVAAWAAMGQQMARWLTTPARLRAFNRTMAVLLVASLWPLLA